MSFLSTSSKSSMISGSGSNTSHWSTPAPLTPHYFPDATEFPLPNAIEADAKEVLHDEYPSTSATPTRASVAAARVERIRVVSTSSSSSSDVDTPPSIHSYSSALRNAMRERYDEAFRRMHEEGGKPAVDFSWEDEDPIERHVMLVKARAEWAAKRQAEESEATSTITRPAIRPLSRDANSGIPKESMLGRSTPASVGLDEGLPPARPTLLDFRGFSHLTSSDSGSPNGSPGSVCSGGSFEGGSTEDWIDLYGRSRSSSIIANPRTIPMDSPTIVNRMSQATISSEASGSTVRPYTASTSNTTSFFEQGLSVSHAPCSQSTSPSMFQPLPTPAPMSAMANGYFAIPTKSAPAPTSRSYPARPTMGVRQRSRNHPYANFNSKTPDESDASGIGRTDSETMVLRAGLRSQRSRAVTRV